MREVKINGTSYPIAYNMLRMESFLEIQGMTFEQAQEWLSTGGIRALMTMFHDMLAYGAERSGETFDKSIEEVADIVGFDLDVVNGAITWFMPSDDDLKKPVASTSQKSSKKKSRKSTVRKS